MRGNAHADLHGSAEGAVHGRLERDDLAEADGVQWNASSSTEAVTQTRPA